MRVCVCVRGRAVVLVAGAGGWGGRAASCGVGRFWATRRDTRFTLRLIYRTVRVPYFKAYPSTVLRRLNAQRVAFLIVAADLIVRPASDDPRSLPPRPCARAGHAVPLQIDR